VKKTNAILAVLLTAVIASAAYYDLDINPKTQKITAGTTGSYTLTFDTTTSCSGDVTTPCGYLSWDTGDTYVFADIGSGTPSTIGSIKLLSWSAGQQTYVLDVTPQSGVTNGDKDITVDFSLAANPSKVKASVTGGAAITPELSTTALMSVGLIGLFGMVYLRRKN
jgi:hypothetical protein